MTYFSQLLDLIFPRLCVWCETEGVYICKACRKELIPHPDRCPFCHRVMLYGQTCYDCFEEHRHIQWIMVAFVYTTFIKKLIRELKFSHKYDTASFLAERLSLLIQSNPWLIEAQRSELLFVTFVPSHRRRKWVVKGYNQSELLAKNVAKIVCVPCIQWVKKQKHTPSQTKRTRQQRLVNLLGAFTMSEKYTLPENAVIVVIDDITTTGATLDEVAKVWKKIYPTAIIWWVVIWRHGK